MNRFIILFFVALGTFLLVVLIKRPELLSEVWLWLVGLAGGIIRVFQSIKSFFQTKVASWWKTWSAADAATNTEPKASSFDGTTISVMRYSSDEDTTVGLMYVNDQYFCYTLEDAFNEVKVPGKTRVPAGVYDVDFRRVDSELTVKYRNNYPGWFTYHLEIKQIPDFTTVYIHSGGDHTDTEGCLLVSDSINMGDEKTFLTNSRSTFKRFYEFIKGELDKGVKVRIEIRDENWFEQSKAS